MKLEKLGERLIGSGHYLSLKELSLRCHYGDGNYEDILYDIVVERSSPKKALPSQVVSNRRGAVVIVPYFYDNGLKIVLVSCVRPTLMVHGCSNQYELPAGGIEEGESVSDAGLRELMEESGLVGHGLIDLGYCFTATGSIGTRLNYVGYEVDVSKRIKPITDGSALEREIDIKVIGAREYLAGVDSGEYFDSMTETGVVRLMRHFRLT